MTAKTTVTSTSADSGLIPRKPTPAYLVQRAARKRFSFGKVWTAAVVSGKVSDKDKLVAHAVKLKVGAKSDLRRLKFDTLLAKVQRALTTSTPAA